jgi:phytoene synthase
MEERLEGIFRGSLFDNLDAALTDTVNRFPIDIQPFSERTAAMDSKPRYARVRSFYDCTRWQRRAHGDACHGTPRPQGKASSCLICYDVP